MREAVDLANEQSVSVLEAPRIELDRLADGLTHQGLILQVPPYEYAHADDLLTRATDIGRDAADRCARPCHRPTQPWRSGALGVRVRCARCAGARATSSEHDGVRVEDRIRGGGASARGPLHEPVARSSRPTRRPDSSWSGSMPVPMCTIQAVDAGLPMVLVIGAEGAGLSRLVRDTCDQIAGIPISASTESLNASVAAGIALYALAQNRSG